MRRSLVPLALVLLIAGVLASAAAAGPPGDAADLAADCNADGALAISGHVAFRGGSGVLSEDCIVTMAPGSTLALRRIELTSGCCSFIVGDAQESTSVRVDDSTIDLAGAVQLAPGCCAGSGEPGRSETDATAVVRGSTIRGQTVEVSASIADSGGRAVVDDSVLEATDPTFGSATVLASLTGSGGSVTLRDSTVTAVSETRIESGADGRTVARADTFAGPATVIIATGAGGTCTSAANTPPVPCS